jgi:hypothetical protein
MSQKWQDWINLGEEMARWLFSSFNSLFIIITHSRLTPKAFEFVNF